MSNLTASSEFALVTTNGAASVVLYDPGKIPGRLVFVKNDTTQLGTTTITTAAGDIDGASSALLVGANEYLAFEAVGGKWKIVGSSGVKPGTADKHFWHSGSNLLMTLDPAGGGTTLTLKPTAGFVIINVTGTDSITLGAAASGFLTLDADSTRFRASNGALRGQMSATGFRYGDTAGAAEAKLEIAGNTLLEGALRFKVLAVANVSGGGNIGTAAATVDIFSSFDVNQTTAGQTLTLPTPTTATTGRMAIVSNVGSQSFTMLGATVATGGSLLAKWTGAAWSKIS
jgi:hypothetical protein